MSDASTPRPMPFVACVVGLGTYGLMDVCMKAAAISVDTLNALFWRFAIATLLGAVVFALSRAPRWPARASLRLHVKRATVAAVMAYLFFYGLARTPMAEAIAISFIAPIIALFLAAILLGERVGRRSILASLLGLVGVIVIIGGKLGAGEFDADARWGVAAILGSAVLYAWNLILQRQQAQIASPQEIALFQSAFVTAWLALFMPFWGKMPPWGFGPDVLPGGFWGLVVAGAILTLLSMVMLSWSYARGEAQALVPMEYSAFLWAALFGWIFFAEPLEWPILAGALLIVAGCWIVARRRPEIVSHAANPGDPLPG